ncbi:hypothetical protein [Shewanella sp. NIFS-20-20]|uniref:hypothetical protein n=1 Tax=Shewanella sp. NIFS-20-20 TaxID=2853806 RepID=UPI00210EAEE6|nr:hypothetical protein [Shewanella sp. NIFS-20-20]
MTATTSSFVKDGNDLDWGGVTNSHGSCGVTGADDDDSGRRFFKQKFVIAAGANDYVAEFDLAKVL